ncbi:hypothetical protein HY573_02275 [Candidatus Parcubacteria bacterium]|nr:hypothetical protein [Candidatus Parcubacteria bacterium]
MAKIVYQGYLQVEVDEDTGHETVRTPNQCTSGFLVLVHSGDRRRGHVILITQPAPAMRRPDKPDGAVMNVLGERINKEGLTVKQHIVEGAWEEAGVRIGGGDAFVLLNDGVPTAASPGVLTELTFLAYVEVRPDQVSPNRRFGLQEEGERITRHLIPVEEFLRMPCETLAALALKLWFTSHLRDA